MSETFYTKADKLIALIERYKQEMLVLEQISEAMDPVALRLAVHATDPGGRIPAHPVQHRSQREQASALVGVARGCGKAAKGKSAEIAPQQDGSRLGANPPRAKGITIAAQPPS